MHPQSCAWKSPLKTKSSNFDDCCRSKNLDILFKRDYYEQRLAIQRLASEQADKEAQGQTQGEEVVEAEEVGTKIFSVVIILFLSWYCSLFEESSLKSAAAGGRDWQQRGRRGRKRDGRHCSSSWSDTQAGQVLWPDGSQVIDIAPHPSIHPYIHSFNHTSIYFSIHPCIFSEIPEFKPTGSKAADIEGETSGHTRWTHKGNFWEIFCVCLTLCLSHQHLEM